MQVTRGRAKSPRGALLHPDIGLGSCLCRIGGRLRSWGASLGGANVEIPPLLDSGSNRDPLSGRRTVSGGQFDWGGRLLKCNGGAQRYAQAEWKPAAECKGISVLDCETHTSSRDQNRA